MNKALKSNAVIAAKTEAFDKCDPLQQKVRPLLHEIGLV